MVRQLPKIGPWWIKWWQQLPEPIFFCFWCVFDEDHSIHDSDVETFDDLMLKITGGETLLTLLGAMDLDAGR